MIFTWICSVLLGILLGISITVYFIVKSIRKTIKTELEKDISFEIHNGNVKNVENIIKNNQQEYKRQNKGIVFRQVLGLRKNKSTQKLTVRFKDEINEIAKEFNPTSKNPILEFSVKNAFDFVEMITIRCEKLLDSISLPVIKSCDVSVVFGVTKFIVVVKDNKIVKTVTGIIGKVTRILKCLKPYYWLKKTLQTVFITLVAREIAFALIEIIGWTFTEFYYNTNENQKNILVKEKETA